MALLFTAGFSRYFAPEKVTFVTIINGMVFLANCVAISKNKWCSQLSRGSAHRLLVSHRASYQNHKTSLRERRDIVTDRHFLAFLFSSKIFLIIANITSFRLCQHLCVRRMYTSLFSKNIAWPLPPFFQIILLVALSAILCRYALCCSYMCLLLVDFPADWLRFKKTSNQQESLRVVNA